MHGSLCVCVCLCMYVCITHIYYTSVCTSSFGNLNDYTVDWICWHKEENSICPSSHSCVSTEFKVMTMWWIFPHTQPYIPPPHTHTHSLLQLHQMCDETHSWINEKDQALSTEDCGRDLSSVQALQRRHQVKRNGREGCVWEGGRECRKWEGSENEAD